MSRRCALLSAWGSAWLANSVTFDEVLDAVVDGQRHRGDAGFGAEDVHPVSSALIDWRRAGAECVLLALPVPGDTRGLVGTPEFNVAALAAGEVVVGADTAVTATLGPETPSSAGREIWWYRSPVSASVPTPGLDGAGTAEAEHVLIEAIRETATSLSERNTVSWLTDFAPVLADVRRAGEKLNLPSSHPPRAVRLIAQAERLAAVLDVVDSDDTGELTAAAMSDRVRALDPLRRAVRQALVTGYNAAAEVIAG